MAGIFEFLANEVKTLFAPAEEVIAASHESRVLYAISVINGAGASEVASIEASREFLRTFVRVRRLAAAFYVFFCLLLPAGVVTIAATALAGWTRWTLVFAAVAFVPCMVIGLLIGAKLAPAFFRALGLSSTSAGGP